MKTLIIALRTIVNADATMRTLCGRNDKLVSSWRASHKATVPVVLYAIASDTETGQAGNHREVLLQLSCLADGDGAVAKTFDMEDRLRAILTQKAFSDNGCDAAPILRTAREVNEPGDAKLLRLARRDLDLTLNVKLA